MNTGAVNLRGVAELLWPRKRWVLFGSVLSAGLTFGMTSILPVRYGSEGSLLTAPPGDAAGGSEGRLTDADLLRSRALLESVVADLGLARQPQLVPQLRLPGSLPVPPWLSQLQADDGFGAAAALDYVTRHVAVTSSEHSRVLLVGFDAGSPALAADVVNALMQRYIADDLRSKQEVARRANAWLQDQADAARREADAADEAVRAFQASHRLVSLSAGSLTALDLNTRREQLATARQDLMQAQSASDQSKTAGGQAAMASPTLDALRQREAGVLQRLAAAGALGERNAARVAAGDELRAIRAQIAGESGSYAAMLSQRLAAAKARVDALQAGIASTATEATGSGESQLELDRLLRTAQARHASYNARLEQAQQSAFAAVQVATGRIVSPAVPPLRPLPSRRAISVLLGLLVGAFIPIALFVARHLVNARVASAMGLAEASGVPSLGALPTVRGAKRRGLAASAIAQPHGGLAETLRGVRLSLLGGGASRTSRVVLVSSAERGEGKTSLAAALALRAAADGMRTLLVECDLHRPRLAGALGLAAPRAGLEAALGGECEYGSVLQADAKSGLQCLLSTGSHPNPISLLDSARFAQLIADARASYDLVVLDSPPVLRVSDAVVLSRWADGIVLVVRADHTPQGQVFEALNRFPADRQEHLFTLLTRARVSRAAPWGYYAGYGDAREHDGPSATATPPRTPPAQPALDAKLPQPMAQR